MSNTTNTKFNRTMLKDTVGEVQIVTVYNVVKRANKYGVHVGIPRAWVNKAVKIEVVDAKTHKRIPNTEEFEKIVRPVASTGHVYLPTHLKGCTVKITVIQ